MTRRYLLLEHPSVLGPARSPELRDVFHVDMKRLARYLAGATPRRYANHFDIVQDAASVQAFMAEAGPTVALDIELDFTGQADMVAVACSPEHAMLLPLPAVDGLIALTQALVGRQVIVHFAEGLEIEWLLGLGLRLGPVEWDVTLEDTHKLFHAWDPEYAHGGDDGSGKLARRGSGALAFLQSLFTERPYHKHMLGDAGGDFALKSRYCCLDACVTWEIFDTLGARMRAERPWAWEAYQRERPLLPIMVAMRRQGVPVDKARFEERREALVAQSKTLALGVAEAFPDAKPKSKKAKGVVSASGLRRALEARGVRVPLHRTTRKPTVNREARQALARKGIEGMGVYDEYTRTLDFLGDFYKPAILGRDGACHPFWSGYLTSWRWRCTEPNIAQHPATERVVFAAPAGQAFVQVDTASGEYRWFAGECGDARLVDVFRAYDATGDPTTHPHVVNAATLFGVVAAEAAAWKADQHPHHAKYVFAKNYIFRRLNAYTGGEDSLRDSAAKAGWKYSRKLIQELDRTWDAAFPQARAWIDKWVDACLTRGYTLCREWGYGRVLHGQGIHVANKALDHVWQAGIAGLINRCVREAWTHWGIVPCANMHDGLLYLVEDGVAYDVARWLKANLEQTLATLKGGIIIRADMATGSRWGELARLA